MTESEALSFVCAQMGPSGSGKTTLLDVLAGRKTQGTISGEIAFSNHSPSKMFLRRYTGYVEQFDTLLGMLTVKEMLMYTAELKVRVTTASLYCQSLTLPFASRDLYGNHLKARRSKWTD